MDTIAHIKQLPWAQSNSIGHWQWSQISYLGKKEIVKVNI